VFVRCKHIQPSPNFQVKIEVGDYKLLVAPLGWDSTLPTNIRLGFKLFTRDEHKSSFCFLIESSGLA